MDTVLFDILPGLEVHASDELKERFTERKLVQLKRAKGEIVCATDLSFDQLLQLRLPVAVYLLLSFKVERPKSLLASEHLNRLVKALRRIEKIHRGRRFSGLRISAAGSQSSVMKRLSAELSRQFRIPEDSEDGDLLIRLRKGADAGWEVLIRLTHRPLSARKWRVENYRGALNATVAATAARIAGVRATDRILNLMCGSGTMLIERLLLGKSACAIGIDRSDEAIRCAERNLRSAGVADRCKLVCADVFESEGWSEQFDVILSDLPWGEVIGKRADNEKLYERTLLIAESTLSPQGRVVLITQDGESLQKAVDVHKGFCIQKRYKYLQSGFHPTLFVLSKK